MGTERQERSHYANQCGGPRLRRVKKDTYKQKFCYDNFLDALYAAVRTERIWPDDRWSVYQCGSCGFIHVGRMHPNAILYMNDMVPVIPAAATDNPPQHEKTTLRSALPKKKKLEIMRAHGLLPAVGTGYAKIPAPLRDKPWARALEESTRNRGYRPFAALRELLPDHSTAD